MCTCVGVNVVGVVSQAPSTFVFRQDLSLAWNLPVRLECLAYELQKPIFLLLSSVGISGVLPCLIYYTGARDRTRVLMLALF